MTDTNKVDCKTDWLAKALQAMTILALLGSAMVYMSGSKSELLASYRQNLSDKIEQIHTDTSEIKASVASLNEKVSDLQVWRAKIDLRLAQIEFSISARNTANAINAATIMGEAAARGVDKK